ncbi:MAG: S26 family signal peptidase [Candidatus Velthaea sp.]
MTPFEIGAASALGLAVIGAGSIYGAPRGLPGLRVNFSSSVPVGLYLYVPGPVTRNDLVQACLPEAIARYAIRNAIVFKGGACTNGTEPIVKVLAGEPGDAITVDREIRVNDRTWPSSRILSRDARGRAVDMRLPRGSFTIAPKHVLLLGLHPHSWDGRYFGALPSSAVTGRWLPLLTDKKVQP